MSSPISPSEAERFALEYVKDQNATQAYLRIRPKTKPKSAETLGARMLGRVGVQEAIEKQRTQTIERLRVDAQKVIDELAICGFSDVRHYLLSDSGHFDIAKGVDDGAGRAISSVKHKSVVLRKSKAAAEGADGAEDTLLERTTELKMWDKPKALITLAKHLGLIDAEKERGASVSLTWRYVEE